MRITLLGAAGGDVTGSAYLIETSQARVLLDFGIFQGRGAYEKNILPQQLAPGQLDAVILTHAHLDHTGRLPLLAKAGYSGKIFCTPATIEMAALVLKDSAKVQAQDIQRLNRKRERAGEDRLDPLYSAQDVQNTLTLFRPLEYKSPQQIAPGIVVRMREAGHMLGSASIEVRADGKTVVFSGDLGPRGAAILQDPDPFECADLVFLESTYGDRNHKPLRETLAEFEAILNEVIERKGKIMVPSFAIGRTQQILYYLGEFFLNGKIKPFPVYIDSPMAIQATSIYQKHPELFDEESKQFAGEGAMDELLRHVHMSETPDDSRGINFIDGPCLIMAGAGMCNAGRILHHLKNNLWKRENAVVIVGYQAEGSLGRQLVDGHKYVNIFGERISVQASVHTLGGFSAHAGQGELLDWFAHTLPCKPRVALTHGEDKARKALDAQIAEKFSLSAILPNEGQTLEV
ncbi:MAG: MBL fold metallo-hydrolase [Verrucomicrobiota bacterium]|nr:MBL fold metallo-hydrolase [Verrucomicrobiota bacterium]